MATTYIVKKGDTLSQIAENYRDVIRDENGNIVDRNLSYEAALLYIDSSVGKYYVMEPMKKEDDHE